MPWKDRLRKAMATSGEKYLESLLSGQWLDVQYPHCDPRVLHAPRECQYCDFHGLWQQARINAKILFTNDPRNSGLVEMVLNSGRMTDEEGWTPCPGYLQRGEAIKIWGGNQARPQGAED